MKKWISRLIMVFLVLVAVLGMLAYVMQNAFGDDITFAEFFEMMRNR